MKVLRVDVFEPVALAGPAVAGVPPTQSSIRASETLTIEPYQGGGYKVRKHGQKDVTRIGPANVKFAHEVEDEATLAEAAKKGR